MIRRKTRLPCNWRSRIEIVREDFPEARYRSGKITFELLFKKGQTPKGFCRYIGSLEVSDSSPHFVDTVEIDEYFWRRGLGTLLYVYALNQLGTLSTRYHSASESAQGLWRSLVRNHNHRVDFFAGTLVISHKGGSK